MFDAVSKAARPEVVQADHRLGALAQGLVQLPVLAIGADQRSDNEFLQTRAEALIGSGLGPQLDVKPERLAVCLVIVSYQVELPADGS